MIKHLREYKLSFGFTLLSAKTQQHAITIKGNTYTVKNTSQRYKLFLRERSDLKCVTCGLEASFFGLDTNEPPTAHFNLYGRKDGEKVLFTKDHIIPKSKGGGNRLDNYQLMCSPCNNKKANNLPSRNSVVVLEVNSNQEV